MSITMYDEIFDSFEEAYGDYLFGEKDYYDDSAARDMAQRYEEQENYAVQNAASPAAPVPDLPEPEATEPDETPERREVVTNLHNTAAPKPVATEPDNNPERQEVVTNLHSAAVPDAVADSHKMTLEELADMAAQEHRDADLPVSDQPQSDDLDHQVYDPPAAAAAQELPPAAARATLLNTIPSDELMLRCYPRRRFLVEGLLTPGLSVLAGSPKVGKSWLVLHLCMQVAKGEPFLGLPTTQGSVLYIALEDDNRRLQNRVYRITDEGSPHLHLVTACAPIGDRLDEEICDFVEAYRDTRLIVIDTFQKIREQGRELSYANDYAEVSFLKQIADGLNLCILLVHHTRKQGDSDYMNEISGTNGIAGSADTLMVLKKENRSSRTATLSCTGRDIEDREMKLCLDRETCIWELKSDSLAEQDHGLPEEITELIAYMKEIGRFEGTCTAFANGFMNARGFVTTPIGLSKAMNQWRYELEDHGVSFVNERSNKARTLTIDYNENYDKTLRGDRS